VKPPGDEERARKQIVVFQSLLATASDRETVLYAISTEQAHLGEWDAAYRNLKSAVAGRPWFDPSEDAAFQPVLGCPILQQVIGRVHSSHPAMPAELYRTIAPADLIPEGLAVDPATGDFYLSSIFHRKIVRFRADGSPHDFISSGQDGAHEVLGIRIDPRDHTVWANSEAAGKAWLHHWDRSGKLIARYTVEGGEHLFNDLVVDRKGNVYLTDSAANSLYTLQQGSQALEQIRLPKAFYPNGIALAPMKSICTSRMRSSFFWWISRRGRCIGSLRPRVSVSPGSMGFTSSANL
jgi:streptogramin lyase